MLFRKFLPVILVSFFAITLLFFFSRLTKPSFLTFSDAAKIAEVGRNLAAGKGFGTKFILFTNSPSLNKEGVFSARVIPPLMPLLDALSFKIFGMGDSAVIAVSSLFYLLLTVSVYLLAKKLFGTLAGVIAAVGVAANQSMLAYAASGASETLFAFEIVIAIYLFSNKKLLTDIFGFIVLFLLLLTRAHAPFYIIPILFYFIQLRTGDLKKSLKIFSLISLAGLVLIGVSLAIPGLPFGKLLIERVLVSLAHNSSFAPANDVLRMNQNTLPGLIGANILPLVKKLFYNLYNFYKLIPEIFSPYLFGLFLIGLFKWRTNKDENALRLMTTMAVVLVVVVNALTVPLYRYLHPLIPLIYILGAATLVWLVRKAVDDRSGTIIISLILIIIFAVGQTAGFIFLDSRFTDKTVNKNKPPVYVVLSKILKDNTNEKEIVVTNLDTWGSWYGSRRTIWYPLESSQLKDLDSKKISIDAIYLTSYLMNDENDYMGDSWRRIYNNPQKISDEYIARNYKLKGIYEVKAEETYEKEAGRAVLLVKKSTN